MRATKATRTQTLYGLRHFWESWKDFVRNPKKAVQAIYENMSSQESDLYAGGFQRLTLKNPFSIGEIGFDGENRRNRNNYISENGNDYFETNVEVLLIHYLNKYITTKKMQEYLVGAKSMILQLELMKDEGSNSKYIDKELEYLNKFLRINVFRQELSDNKWSNWIMAAIHPLKRVTSALNLAGNVTGAVRDSIQGAAEGIVRSVTKYKTDLNAESISKAYAFVVTHGGSTAMRPLLLGKLNIKYRISNVDLARIEQRAITGRSGLVNFENKMYSTMRAPDFLNRMVLFVARCIKDGTIDAYSLNENDELVYNWKKDKRFSAYATGDTNNPLYKK
jgi:hypothetical protein